jgi:hypothetical protein
MLIRFVVSVALLVFAGGGVAVSSALELVMFDSPDCEWCETWEEEVGEGYHLTSESRAAPLRRVDIEDQEKVKGLERPITYTPTFVLLSGGVESGRISGYPGADFFYPLLDNLIAKAQRPAS